MYKQHHYDHHLKKKSRRKPEILKTKKSNHELNILQEGQQCTVDPMCLYTTINKT